MVVLTTIIFACAHPNVGFDYRNGDRTGYGASMNSFSCSFAIIQSGL